MVRRPGNYRVREEEEEEDEEKLYLRAPLIDVLHKLVQAAEHKGGVIISMRGE